MHLAKATIRDVASAAGVSVATVSRVLNDMPTVHAELRARVTAEMERLQYRPQPSARGVRGVQTGLIGMLLPRLDLPTFTCMAESAIREALTHKQGILLYTASGNLAEEQRCIDLLARMPIDGLIYWPLSTALELGRIDAFSQLPVVGLGRPDLGLGVPCVSCDIVASEAMLTRYLLRLGRRRIAIMIATRKLEIGTIDRLDELANSPLCSAHIGLMRYKGYRQALAESGVPFDPALCCLSGYEREDGHKCASKLLGSGVPFDALIAANDEAAWGAMECLRQQGVRVPETVSVFGHDNSSICSVMRPTLSSLDYAVGEAGKRAVKAINCMLNGSVPEETLLRHPVSLALRESTCSVCEENAQPR